MLGLRAFVLRWSSLALLVAAWELAVVTRVADPQFVPALHDVARALLDLAFEKDLWEGLAVSTMRALVGLALGTAGGVLIGTLMATSARANAFLGPLVATTYSLPKASLVPLFLLWFGVGNTTNILTVFLATLLPVVVGTYQGVKSVPQVLVWSARALGTSPLAIVLRVQIPGALLPILTGVRVALGFSWVLTLSAEMIAAKTGIGKLIFVYGESGAYAYMFAGIGMILAVAYAADRLLVAITARLLHWNDGIAAHREGTA